jgi:hypothetical protein
MRIYIVEHDDSPMLPVERVPAAVRDSIASLVFSSRLKRAGFAQV